MAIDKYGTERAWAWGSTLKIAEGQIKKAIRDFIKMEGHLYGKITEWTVKWELRTGAEDHKNYLPKPTKKPPKTRRNISDESAI